MPGENSDSVDARAGLGLYWVNVRVVGVDVLRFILQGMCIKMYIKRLSLNFDVIH